MNGMDELAHDLSCEKQLFDHMLGDQHEKAVYFNIG